MSDLAGDRLQAAFPELFVFDGTGGTEGTIDALVVDRELRAITGRIIRVEFDLGSWKVLRHCHGHAIIRSANPGVYADLPIMVSVRHGRGTIFYTCFHNRAQQSAQEQRMLQLLVLKQISIAEGVSVEQASSSLGVRRFPTEIRPPELTSRGLTNYGPAFREFHRAFEADRARLRAEGKRIYRPCVFFLTDGEPTDGDYEQVFTSLLGYDPATKEGNSRYPYVTAFGFREATAETMDTITYPRWGEKRGRYFLAQDGADIADLLAGIAGAIANSVVGSAMSIGGGAPRYMPPEAVEGMRGQVLG